MGSEGYGTMIIKSSNRFVDVGGESDGKLWISRMAAILLLGAGVSEYDTENITTSFRCKLPRKS